MMNPESSTTSKRRILRIWLGAFALTGTLLGSSSCSEILSADIGEDSVIVNSPADSFYTQNTSILFWWEENRDIEAYRFQLAHPDFASPDELTDTSLFALKLTLTLGEGRHTWRIQGDNESSETPFVTRTLFVDLSDPDKATATHLDGDTLAVGDADSLRWTSRDQPLDGVRYDVADSVYLSLVNDSTRFLEPAFIDFGEAKVYPAEDATGSLGSGKYYWYLITVDQAGNTRKSNLFSFLVQ